MKAESFSRLSCTLETFSSIYWSCTSHFSSALVVDAAHRLSRALELEKARILIEIEFSFYRPFETGPLETAQVFQQQVPSIEILSCDSELSLMKRTAEMDQKLVPILSSPAQEEPRILPLYVHPYSYLQAAGLSQPPVAKSFVAQENDTRKSMFPTEESGKNRSRWRSHKKETCKCAVCKQVRGELSSTWFNHDKANCACSVCKQARGEKRSVKRKAKEELKVKTSSISNRVRRLAGMALPPKRNADRTETGISQVSDKLSVTQSASAASEESSAESSSLIPMVSSNQSNMVAAVASRSGGASSSDSNFGFPNKNVSGIVEDSTLGRFANLRSLFDGIQTAVMESSVNISNLTPSVQSSQPVQSDTSRFSWKTGAPYAESQSEISFQSIPQASYTWDLGRPGERTVVSKVDNNSAAGDHSCSFECSSRTSVVPSRRFDAGRTSLTSVSVSDGKSDINCQVTPDITDPSRTSRLADQEVGLGGSPGFCDESLLESSSVTTAFSRGQLDKERASLKWSAGPSISESENPSPRVSSVQTSRDSGIHESLIWACVPDAPHVFVQEPSVITSRKKRKMLMCTSDRNTSGCDRRADRTPCLNHSCESNSECIQCTSNRTRRNILSFRMQITRSLSERLHGVSVIPSAYPSEPQIFEELANMSLLSPSIGRRYKSGCEAPATFSGPCSHNSGLSLNLQGFGSKIESTKRPTRPCPSNNQITPASPFTIRFASSSQSMDVIHVSSTNGWVKLCDSTPSVFTIYVRNNLDEYMKDGFELQTATQDIKAGISESYTSLVKISEQVLEKLFKGSRVAICDIYTVLTWILEQAGEILPRDMKLRILRVRRGHPASGPSNYQQYPHHTQLSLVEVPSQKAADVRTHRSQSALLLGVQPCSFSSLINHPRNLLPFTSLPNEELSSDRLLTDLRNLSNSSSVPNSYSGLEAGVCHQARPLHDVQPQIQRSEEKRRPVTEKRRPVLAISKLLGLPCVQLGPRTFIDPNCTIRPNNSCSCLSICAREGCGFGCTDAAEVENGSLVDTGVTPEKKSTKISNKLNVEDITTLAQDDITVLQRGAGKRKDTAQCSDAAVNPPAKRMKTSWRVPRVSTMSSVLRLPFGTAKNFGNFSASAFVRTKNAASQLLSKSNGESVTRSQGNSYVEKVSSSEADKPDDDLPRQLEQLSQSKSDRHGSVAASQSLNAPMQRKKPPITHRVRQTAQFTAEATTVPERPPALPSGLSFQELLSSVSQNLAVTYRNTGSGGEGFSNHSRFSIERNSCSSIFSKAQGLQGHSYSYREVSSCKQPRNLSTSGEDSRLDAREIINKDMNLGGDLSSLQNDFAINSASKSKKVEDTHVLQRVGVLGAYELSTEKGTTNIRKDLERYSEEVNSFQEMQEPKESIPSYVPRRQDHAVRAEESSILSLLPNLIYRRDKIAALLHESTQARDVMVPDEPDVVEVEALQSNVLVEQEKTEFQQKLSMLLEKPFDPLELDDLEKSICVRKPQMRLRESRQEVRHVPLRKEGLSYLEHYPEFRRKLESASAPEDKLKLLRGFFFWIQHTCMSGAFMPWEEKEEDDDIQIVEENVVSNRHTISGKSTQVKEIRRQDKSGGGTKRTKVARPGSIMHMSLRARKKTVYKKTSKPQKAKKIVHQLATTKVKTEGHEDNAPETLLKGNPAIRIVTARRASLNEVEKVRKRDKSARHRHRKYGK
ncbi:hypothetical protein Mapa_003968 [Marchantia paleacea]|nr:hypothetical protein Mapa_003968 [Marchantia paleacea]